MRSGVAFSVLMVVVILMVTGCSREPEIRFTENWDPEMNMDKAWVSSGKVIIIEKLKGTGFERDMTLLIHGKLPLGEIGIGAIKVLEGGGRKEAMVFPEVFENKDPEADLRARKFFILPEKGAKYQVFLHFNGEKIAITDLEIR